MTTEFLQHARTERNLSGSFAKRLAAMVLLLVAELLVLSQLVDSGHVTGREWWAIVLRKSPNLAQALLLGWCLWLLLGSVSLWTLWRRHVERHHSAPAFSRIGLGFHVASFVALACISKLAFGPQLRAMADPALWVVLWALLVCGTTVSWTLTIIPRALWRGFAPRALQVACVAAPFGVLAWGAGRASRELWEPLSALTITTVAAILHALGQECVMAPASREVGTVSFQVGILDGCSGLQGMGLTTAFLSAYCVLCRKQLRFPHGLVLIPVAVLASWLANALRIAVLILIGTYISPELALGGFHSQAGWIAFCGIALGMVLVTQRVAWFQREPRRAEPLQRPAHNPAAAYLVPFLAALAGGMVGTAVPARFDLAPLFQVVSAVVVLLGFWKIYRAELTFRTDWMAVAAGAGLCLFWIAASYLNGDAGIETAQAPAWTYGDPGWQFWAVVWCLRAFVTVPIVEELAFRGYLLRWLQQAHFEDVPMNRFTWRSFLISSVLFGLLHPEHLVAGTVAGMVFAAAMLRRGRLVDAIVAHAVTNLLLATYAWSTGDWQAWG